MWLAVISCSQIAFLLFCLDGKEKGLVNALYNFCSQNLYFLGIFIFMHDFWLVLKDRKGSLIGDSGVIILYCQAGQRLCELFLSFNTNQKSHIKSPKMWVFWEQKFYRVFTIPFSSHLNTKEEKQSGYTRLD